MAEIYINSLGIIVLLSMVSMFTLVYTSKRGNSVYEIIFSLTVFISNVGYFFLARAKEPEMAFLANALGYLGGIFLPFLILLILAGFSKTKLPAWFLFVLTAVNVLLYLTILLSDKYTFYYNDVLFVAGPPARLDITPGPFYYLRLVVMGVEILLSLFFTTMTYTGKRKASFKTMFLFVGMLVVGSVVYATERIIDTDYELIPLFYLISALMLNYLTTRTVLYDVTLSVQEKIEEVNDYAYMVFDGNFNFVGCNTAAAKFFPELKDARIDVPLTADNYALKNILAWVHDNSAEWIRSKDKQSKFIKEVVINDRNPEERRYLTCEMSYIHFGITGRVMGFLIEMSDNTEQRDRVEQLSFQSERLQREADKQAAKVKSLQSSTILGMASMIESRDNSTGGHINRTSACVALFVEYLRTSNDYTMTESYWDDVINAAPLHDLGKIAVDDAILKKPSGLTDKEYSIMKIHAEYGAEIVRKVLADVDDKEFVRVAANVAHYHHEKYDGSGYPEGLKGEEIPFEARIMAVVDVFDALASRRYYKEPMTYEEAFGVIHDEIGSHFDPQLAKIFLSLRDDIQDLYESFEGTDYAR